MSGIPIVKMSGAGNDFVVVGPDAAERVDVAWVRRVCRRGLSVGADGVLFVEPMEPGRVRVRFMNPDGSRAFCGNGTRCAARYAYRRGYAAERMTLRTDIGPVPARLEGERVSIELPPPRDHGSVELDLGGTRLSGAWVDAGCPHFVTFVDDVESVPLAELAPKVRRHRSFGERGVNVNFVERRDDGALAIRTWERGVEGETLACGSGAVATGFVAARAGARGELRLVPASGVALGFTLNGDLDAPRSVTLAGDARVVFEAELDPEATCGF